MHPFDPKAIFFPRHAQHVVLIHFPIALFLASVLFDFIAQWTKNRTLAAAAYYNLLLASISTLPVVATGLLAWQFQLEGQKLKGILLLHLVLGCTSAILIWLVYYLHLRLNTHTQNSLPVFRLALETVAVAAIALTGHLGGFLSGVNGPS